jgi:N6-adenosine-specific RNA methylase IME4
VPRNRGSALDRRCKNRFATERLQCRRTRDRRRIATLEADAVEIRMRATRRLDQLRQAQKESVGLNTGTRGQLAGGLKTNPPGKLRPTLASQGIDKALAHQARVLGRLSDKRFNQAVADARRASTRTVQRTVNAVAIEQARESYGARIQNGCSVDDLTMLADSGFRASTIYADPAWPSGSRIAAHYDAMTLGEIKALPVAPLAADNAVLFLWILWSHLALGHHLEIIEAWGFEPRTVGFVWIKTAADGRVITGMGAHTRYNSEPCILATRGSPLRLDAAVPQVLMAAPGEHSAKPAEVARRIERLYPAPRLELFARRPRDNWLVWGDEIPRADLDFLAPRFAEAAE